MSDLDPPAHTAPHAGRSRRATARLVAAIGLTVLVTLFAVFNLGRVEVNWLIGTWETPLILVIVGSALLGALADRILQHRSAKS